ncbi:helix-hairpin-helix domain-containing protein [Streptomyces thermoviolaceus]|uniref:helix-hairpin-helix domain-containing protein n=1 Tax=Streptomyces thermoviolaceus TaxID=1952 RepID=UPI0038672C97
MARRSHTRTATATSGPGRCPGSDSRTRHRRLAGRTGRGHRQARADELRRRAEALFTEHLNDMRHCNGMEHPNGTGEPGTGSPPVPATDFSVPRSTVGDGSRLPLVPKAPGRTAARPGGVPTTTAPGTPPPAEGRRPSPTWARTGIVPSGAFTSDQERTAEARVTESGVTESGVAEPEVVESGVVDSGMVQPWAGGGPGHSGAYLGTSALAVPPPSRDRTGREGTGREGPGRPGRNRTGRDSAGGEGAGRDGTGHGATRAETTDPEDEKTGPDAPATGLDAQAAADDEMPGRAERAGLALTERLPLWMQTRCGLERRHVVALTVVFAVAVVVAVQHFWSGRTQDVRAPEVVRAAAPAAAHGDRGHASPAAPASPDAPGASPGPGIVVDVSGKVRHPGVHHLPAGSRVADALRAAGGVRPGTDLSGLNRARFLVDGEQVVVGGPAPAPGPAAAATAAGAAGAPTAPVSLNTATAEQLQTLPGVGPVLARHIIDYRTQHGGFRSVEELRQVTGIGDRRYADLRDLVTP